MKELLTSGINKLQIKASEDQINSLLKFVELLKKWNKVYNLTALKTDKEIIQLHLLDSLTVLPYLNEVKNILDVGSGAGLPGIPLAIFLPEVKFVLLDSNGKKTRFIQQAIIDLGLKNCSVQNSRIEDFAPTEKFDIIITRAFAEIKDALVMLKHFSSGAQQFYFMKSRNIASELGDLDKTYAVQSITLSVPGLDAERSLVILSKNT